MLHETRVRVGHRDRGLHNIMVNHYVLLLELHVWCCFTGQARLVTVVANRC